LIPRGAGYVRSEQRIARDRATAMQCARQGISRAGGRTSFDGAGWKSGRHDTRRANRIGRAGRRNRSNEQAVQSDGP
jgi:hypothetical protein